MSTSSFLNHLVLRSSISHTSTCTLLDLWLCMICIMSVGCGSYSQSSQKSRQALLRGDAASAVTTLNARLDQAAPSSDRLLILLERGIALQYLGRYRESINDLQRADDGMEMIDYTKTPLKDLATYLYSDDASPYRPPAFEKAMINVFNMVNYLALKEWAKAKVEVRRLEVLESFWQEYLEEESKEDLHTLRRLIHWVSAFTYLATGDLNLALKEAERGQFKLPLAPQRADGQRYSPLFIFSSSGMVPHRIAQRLPLGRALLYIGPHPSWSRSQKSKLARIQAKGLVKWLNFPSLSTHAPAHSEQVLLDQIHVPPILSLSLTKLVRSSYDQIKPKLIAAAITRLLTRAVVGEVTEALGKSANRQALGFLLSLVAEGSMAAADTPDTRSWSNLPDRVQLYWLWLPPGDHHITMQHPLRTWQMTFKVLGDGQPLVLNYPNSSTASNL